MKQRTYAVQGMHCPSCEAIIIKKALKLDGVSSAEASTAKGTLTIYSEHEFPEPDDLTRLFPEGLYTFSDESPAVNRLLETVLVLGYAVAAIVLFFGLTASGLLPSLAIDRNSSAGAFFLFGLIAGVSTCAALVGSLVLALSTQWKTPRIDASSIGGKLRPQLLFNTGRIAAYAMAGVMLGALGESARISSDFTSVMVIAVSALMLVLALQMLGFTPFNAIRIALPKRLVTKAGSGMNSGGLLRPFPSGFMTVLLPCGFTMAAEGAAILSGSPVHGMAIMTSFVLGTTPPLLAIGLSSFRFSSRPATSRIFMKTAALLIMFFTIYNLDSQFGIAGRIASRTTQPTSTSTAPATGNPRIVRTIAANGTLDKAQFELKAGEQVRFIVDPKDNGAGCMNAIRVPGLWNQAQYLVKGKPIVMQFTPLKRGTYQITCGMGMPWGVITVK